MSYRALGAVLLLAPSLAAAAPVTSQGASDLMDPDVAAYYKGTFNDEALAKLWWWPNQSAEFLTKRAEYADKFKAA